MSEKILLSIYIPTYNRPKELLELLNNIKNERSKLIDPSIVEVVVSDNCSNTDIKHFINDTSLIDSYTKNDINIGADENILMYYKKTKGEFVWLIGDDDLIAKNSLKKIITLLNKIKIEDCDLIFLNSQIEDMSGNILNSSSVKTNVNGMIKSNDLVDIVNTSLLTMSCLIIRRKSENLYYESLYGKTFYVSPLAIALDRLSHKPYAYLFNYPIIRYREGDKSGWSMHWSMISLVYVPYVLNEYIILSKKNFSFDPFLFDRKRIFEFVKLIINFKNYNKRIFKSTIKKYFTRKNTFIIILKSLDIIFFKLFKKLIFIKDIK